LGDLDRWATTIHTIVADTQRQIQAAFDTAPKDTRKDFALWVQANHPHLSSYLFAKLDNKPFEPLIYKLAFQNLPDERAFSPSEGTA
jgi:hypothetical protein